MGLICMTLLFQAVKSSFVQCQMAIVHCRAVNSELSILIVINLVYLIPRCADAIKSPLSAEGRNFKKEFVACAKPDARR